MCNAFHTRFRDLSDGKDFPRECNDSHLHNLRLFSIAIVDHQRKFRVRLLNAAPSFLMKEAGAKHSQSRSPDGPYRQETHNVERNFKLSNFQLLFRTDVPHDGRCCLPAQRFGTDRDILADVHRDSARSTRCGVDRSRSKLRIDESQQPRIEKSFKDDNS